MPALVFSSGGIGKNMRTSDRNKKKGVRVVLGNLLREGEPPKPAFQKAFTGIEKICACR